MEKVLKKCTVLIGSAVVIWSCSGGGDDDTTTNNNAVVAGDSLNYTPLNYSTQAKLLNGPTSPFFQVTDFSANVITESDPSTFLGLEYAGQKDILFPDDRIANEAIVAAHSFQASVENHTVSLHVNPEFGTYAEAQVKASYYAEILGRMPSHLLSELTDVYLNKGYAPIAARGTALTVYTDLADELNVEGTLEESVLLETVSIAAGAELNVSAAWQRAQSDDASFISDVAADIFDDEDFAESYLAYLAVRYRENRIAPSATETVQSTIPARLEFFDTLGLNVYPIEHDSGGNWTYADESDASYYLQWEKGVNF